MSTKTKSVLGACITAVVGVLVASYVDEANRAYVVGVAALIVGKLGFAQPGQ